MTFPLRVPFGRACHSRRLASVIWQSVMAGSRGAASWNSCNWNCNFPLVPLAPNTFPRSASWNCPIILACIFWTTLATNVRLHASGATCRLHWNALLTNEMNKSRSQCLTSKQQLITWLAANSRVRYVTTASCKSLAKRVLLRARRSTRTTKYTIHAYTQTHILYIYMCTDIYT